MTATTIARPRTAKKTKSAALRITKSTVSATTLPRSEPSPAETILTVSEIVRNADALICQAQNIGANGDFTGRLLELGNHKVIEFFSALKADAFYSASVKAGLDVLYDLQAVLTGVEAAERGHGRGHLAREAFVSLEQAVAMLDQHGFWPDEPTHNDDWHSGLGASFEKDVAVAPDLMRAQQASSTGRTNPPETPLAVPAGTAAAVVFDADAATRILQRASSISCFLSLIFGRGAGASARELRGLTGLMGSVQHLHRILKDLEDEVAEVDCDLPAFFRGHLTEASHMATLLNEVEWLSGYSFHTGDDVLSSYFDAICAACEDAEATLNAPGASE